MGEGRGVHDAKAVHAVHAQLPVTDALGERRHAAYEEAKANDVIYYSPDEMRLDAPEEVSS